VGLVWLAKIMSIPTLAAPRLRSFQEPRELARGHGQRPNRARLRSSTSTITTRRRLAVRRPEQDIVDPLIQVG
jgi:hypothetical protein